MASFFFNLIRGAPSSPSTPDDKPKGDGICDYCGVFDATSMKWTSALTPSSPALLLQNNNKKNNHAKKSEDEPHTPVFDNLLYRNRSGVSSGFVEKHLKIKDADQEYFHVILHQQGENDGRRETAKRRRENVSSAATKSNQNDDDVETASPTSNTSTTRPIRLVCLADTHQYHRALTLPQGDVLLVCGDILLSDRMNPAVVSNYYVNDFLEWLDEQPHKVKLFLNGNHCHQFAELGEEKILDMCRNSDATKKNRSVFYLTGDEVYDVYGVRFFGNSISFGNSPNKAFQNKETLDKLKTIPYDKVIDCVKIVEDHANSRKNKRAISTSTTTSSAPGKSSTPSLPLLPRRSDNNRAIDIFATHSRLLGWDGDQIAKNVNPNCAHVVGHEHESHGLNLGVVDRATSWISNMQNRFIRRSSMSSLWTSFSSNFTTSSSKSSETDDKYDEIKHVFVDNLIPEINVAIVGELHRWRPALQPPTVFDILPYEE